MRKIFPAKGSGVKDEDGRLIVSPSFFYKDHMSTIQQCYDYTTEGGAINIFDERITQGCKLYGGELWVDEDSVDSVHKDDYIELSVVDKDDVLGAFAAYGLNKNNGDILELTKFVIKEKVRKGSKANGYHADLVSSVKGVSDVPEGLYLRTYYFSSGAQPIDIITKLYRYM